VKNEALRDLYDEAQALLVQFDGSSIDHNYRNKNALADKLANLAMDRKADVLEADDAAPPPADPTPKPASAFMKTGERFNCSHCGCEISLDQLPGDGFTRLSPFVCLCGHRMDRRKALKKE
jgi:hypothetical protein